MGNGETRGSNGRFLPGNPGGPGGGGQRVRMFRQAVLDAVTPEEVAAVFRMLAKRAKRGDLEAAGILLRYATGGHQRLHEAVAIEEREEALRDAAKKEHPCQN